MGIFHIKIESNKYLIIGIVEEILELDMDRYSI